MSGRVPTNIPAVLLRRPEHTPLFDLEVAVVTPLFGGSATPGVTDPLHPVRAASVRGHLRFWWRACHGTRFTSADNLFADEAAIWGSTDLPGRLLLTIETLDVGRDVPCAEYRPNERDRSKLVLQWANGYRDSAYALFPFQGKLKPGNEQVEAPPARAREGVRFRLRLDTVPGLSDAMRASLRDDAEAALWAWFAFGGIGARTRRGCGALYCAAQPFAPPRQTGGGEVISWLTARAAQHVVAAPRRLPLSVLHGARLYISSAILSPVHSWSRAVNLMRAFRQGPDVGRNPGQQQNRPGRSRWPEADSIRRATGRSDSRHSPQHPADAYYPRADLGLPIVFHYQSRYDPTDTVLQAHADGATRMASPIILKPLALSDHEAVPLVLCLDAPHVWDGLTPVRLGAVSGDLPKSHLVDRNKTAQVRPIQENSAGKAESTRTAFLHFAARELKSDGVSI